MKNQNIINEEKGNDVNHVLCTVLSYLETTRRSHYGCEDSFYNCPKHPEEEDYNSDFKNAVCNCGADEYNAKLDEMITLVSQHCA
jgi:hypothetical protein